MNKETQIINELKHNTGTEHYFKIPFSDLVYTDGINDLINRCGSWWLISDLGIEISQNPKLQKPFLLVRVEVKDGKGKITLREDSNLKPIFTKDYEYTDFPLSKFEFYICDKVILLKEEY